MRCGAMANVLGLISLMNLDGSGASGAEHQALDALIHTILEQRASARAEKELGNADRIARCACRRRHYGQGWRAGLYVEP